MYYLILVVISSFIHSTNIPLIPTKAPVGLKNCGVSCYMNSTIQCLYTLNAFTKSLQINRSFIPNPIAQSYINIADVIDVWNSQNPIDPALMQLFFSVFSDVVSKRSYIAAYEQQDASELLDVIFQYASQGNKRIEELISNLVGLTEHRRGATLQSSFMNLSLIANDNLFEKYDSLEGVYQDNLKSQILFDSIQEAYDAEKNIYIPRGIYFPLVVSIFVNFKTTYVKIKYPIQIQETLKTLNGTYQLIAMLCHQGESIGGGHYAAYVKRNEGWYFCNDSIIEFLGGYKALDSHRRLFVSTLQTRLQGEVKLRDFDPYILFYAKEGTNNIEVPNLYHEMIQEFSIDAAIISQLF